MTTHYIPMTKCHDEGCQQSLHCERWLRRMELGGPHAITLRPPGDSGQHCGYFLAPANPYAKRFAPATTTEYRP